MINQTLNYFGKSPFFRAFFMDDKDLKQSLDFAPV